MCIFGIRTLNRSVGHARSNVQSDTVPQGQRSFLWTFVFGWMVVLLWISGTWSLLFFILEHEKSHYNQMTQLRETCHVRRVPRISQSDG